LKKPGAIIDGPKRPSEKILASNKKRFRSIKVGVRLRGNRERIQDYLPREEEERENGTEVRKFFFGSSERVLSSLRLFVRKRGKLPSCKQGRGGGKRAL